MAGLVTLAFAFQPAPAHVWRLHVLSLCQSSIRQMRCEPERHGPCSGRHHHHGPGLDYGRCFGVAYLMGCVRAHVHTGTCTCTGTRTRTRMRMRMPQLWYVPHTMNICPCCRVANTSQRCLLLAFSFVRIGVGG